jgi:DNA-binding transcriptional LysR family regulator
MQADLVVGTDRIATMHERLARRVARHLPVRISPAPLRIPVLTECAQWNRARSEDPGLKWLIDACVRVAATV